MFLPRNLLILIWVVVGIAIAATKNYLDNLETWRRILSALLAVLLWPLLLLGIDLHIRK
jgi:hypothetical protein